MVKIIKIALAIITVLSLIATWYFSKYYSNQAPKAKIEEPANNSVFSEGDSITFRGSATDTEDKVISSENYFWESGREARVIGNGRIIVTKKLSVGLHNIFLQVFDNKGASGTDRITIEIIPKIVFDEHLRSNNATVSQITQGVKSFQQSEMKDTSTLMELDILNNNPPATNKIIKNAKQQDSAGYSVNDVPATETNIVAKSDSPQLPEPLYDISYSKVLFAQRIELNNSSMDSNYKNVRAKIISNLNKSMEYEEYKHQVETIFSGEDAVSILKKTKCGKLVLIDIGLSLKEKSFPYYNMSGTFECEVDFCHLYIFTLSGEKRIHNVLKDSEVSAQTEAREKSVSRCFDKLVPIISREIESILL